MTPAYTSNLAKIKELAPHVQWAANAWLEACWQKGYQFKITEAYRTQERQNELYKIGRRGIPGEKPVTWTLTSNHTKRLAMDVYVINCTHYQLTEEAKRFGIVHPFPTDDPPHYEASNRAAMLMALLAQTTNSRLIKRLQSLLTS